MRLDQSIGIEDIIDASFPDAKKTPNPRASHHASLGHDRGFEHRALFLHHVATQEQLPG
jgi:hypothetical protein